MQKSQKKNTGDKTLRTKQILQMQQLTVDIAEVMQRHTDTGLNIGPVCVAVMATAMKNLMNVGLDPRIAFRACLTNLGETDNDSPEAYADDETDAGALN